MLCGLLPAKAEQTHTTRDNYGEIGLLDLPSGHVAPDGRIAFAFGDIEKTQHYTLDFQALPWLEASFRYSHFIPGQQNYDRSFSLKAQLLTEETGPADISIGLRDLLGTGIYSGEYLVASKHFGPVDVTFGMGWGRLADTGELPNPLGQVFSALKVRGDQAAVTGGAFNIKQYLSGPRVGLFGGIAWQTPLEGLSLIAEYSSDRYTRERLQATNTFPVNSPINLGVSYDVSESLTASAGWYYGSSYGLTLSLSGDVKAQIPSNQRIGPLVPEMAVRSGEQQRLALATLSSRNNRQLYRTAPPSDTEKANINLRQAILGIGDGVRDVELRNTTLMIDARIDTIPQSQCANYARIASGASTYATTVAMGDLSGGNGAVTFCPIKVGEVKPGVSMEVSLRKELAKQKLGLKAIATAPGELWVYYINNTYLKESEAAGRVIRTLMKNTDSSIELFHLFPVLGGAPVREITVARSTIENLDPSISSTEFSYAMIQSPAPLNSPALDSANSRAYPSFTWGVAPRLANQLFDPDNPLQTMILGEASANISIAPGLDFGATASTTLWSNFRFNRAPGSELEHVRTDLLRYLDQGSTGIGYLAASYFSRLTPEVFIQAKSGYLEDMFMGAGGEILWRPERSRFSIGADLYQVWRRDYDRLFGHLPYNVLTGHVTLYYDSPWYGLNFAVHAGRYLAGDKGATFEIKRRFDSGIEIGAFATFTNVPFKKFGEGSFDKGIVIRIPVEWMLPIFTKTSFNIDLRPLTRDGGQRLLNDDSLYEYTRSTSYNEITTNLNGLAAP